MTTIDELRDMAQKAVANMHHKPSISQWQDDDGITLADSIAVYRTGKSGWRVAVAHTYLATRWEPEDTDWKDVGRPYGDPQEAIDKAVEIFLEAVA